MLHRMPQLLIRLQTAVINAIRAHLGHLSREVFCVSSVADWRQGLVLSNDDHQQVTSVPRIFRPPTIVITEGPGASVPGRRTTKSLAAIHDPVQSRRFT